MADEEGVPESPEEAACFDVSEFVCSIEGPTRVLRPKKSLIDYDDESAGDNANKNVELDSLLPDPTRDEEYDPKEKPWSGPVSKHKPSYFLQLWRPVNASLAMSFFTVGLISFAGTAISYYLIKQRGASPTQMSCMASVVSLPWALKIFVGMFSDGTSLFGYRRKTLIILGWLGFAFCQIFMSVLLDPTRFLDPPSINVIILFAFLSSSFMILADVANDALCVERSQFETDKDKGGLQAIGYSTRAAGAIIASVTGALVYNKAEFGWGLSISEIYLLDGLIPLIFVIPFSWPLVEIAPENTHFTSFYEQVLEIWSIVQMRCLWQPMAFIFLYNTLQVPNAAFGNFLINGLKFSPLYMGILDITSTVIALVAMVAYQRFFFGLGIRFVYIVVILAGISTSIMVVLLIMRWNLTINFPDVAFLVLISVINVVLTTLTFVPTIVMFVAICPEGSEGTTYAMLTTISNIGATLASDIGTLLLKIWDCSNAAITAGDFAGVENLTILTSCIQILPIVFVWLLPETKEDLLALKRTGERSEIGGGIVLGVLTFAILFTVVLNLYILLSPDQKNNDDD